MLHEKNSTVTLRLLFSFSFFFLHDEGRTVVYCIIVLLFIIADITTNRVTIIITIAMYKCPMSVTACEWDQNGVCKCVMC